MASPWRIAIDASNQPTAAQNYEHGATALTGFQSPSAGLTDGDQVVILAEEVNGNGAPAGAWEIVEATWNDDTTDFFSRDTLLHSSSGSLIDWSAAGVDAVPRLRVLAALTDSPVELVTAGSFSTSTASIIIGGTPEFEVGWDYEIVLRNVVAGATSFLTALFWDPVAEDWATEVFSGAGYGAYGSTMLPYSSTSAGFLVVHATNTSHSSGQPWNHRMVLRDPANTNHCLLGDFVTSYHYSSSKARTNGVLRSNEETKGYTGIGFVQNTGNFASGRYFCRRWRTVS